MTFKENVENTANYGFGVGAGYATYRYVPKIIKKPIGKYFLKQFQSVPKQDNYQYWNAAMTAYNSTPVLKNNIQIKEINKLGETYVLNLLYNRLNIKKYENNTLTKSKLWKYFIGDRKEKIKKAVSAATKGNNAFCLPMNKYYKEAIVVVNSDKMAFSTFHEMGHAMNKIGKGFDKFLAKTRGLFALGVPAVLLAGLLLNKPQNKESSDMKTGEKIRSGIKKYCGLMAGVCLIPTVLEEGMASIKGKNFAKNVLDKDLLKSLNKLHFKAWSTYAIGAVLTGMFVQFAVWLRDKIVENKPFG